MQYFKIALSQEEDGAYLEAFIAEPLPHCHRRAILVIPGGGYWNICSDREGEPIAHAFMPYGYNAFVLHYTVERKKPYPAQLIEAARAVAHIKDHAEKYGIDPNEVFATGFSAGGHLVASLGVLWKEECIYRATGMPYGHCRVAGVIPVYPVTTVASHFGSCKNLFCTDAPTEEEIALFDLDRRADGDSVPAFFMHTANDQVVDVKGTLALAAAYSKNGVPFELHIYPDAPHGAALSNRITWGGNPKHDNPAIAEWVRMAAVWADGVCRENEQKN